MPGNSQVFTTAINAADHFRWDSQWAEAAREYQRALAEFPDDATARSGLGFCYMQTKQWQQALHEYEYTLKRDTSNVIALSKTAELYGILNRRDDAYKAYLHLADLYSQAGQGARAEAAWQKAVQLSPGSPEPHERLAAYYFEKKEIAQMIQERLAAAQGYLLRNEVGLARAQCEDVLRADGTNTQAHQLLAQLYSERDPGSKSPSGSLYQEKNAPFSKPTDMMGNGPPGDNRPPMSPASSGPLAFESMETSGNFSGGNTGIMGNMGSAGNYGGVGNSGPSMTSTNNGGMSTTPRNRITASQVTGVLKQAQTFQTQGRFDDAIDLCEQILESGFDRPDARYFLGWLYQEQQRWDEAIHQFQMLLNDPDYALSCYYALGQCYRARGDLQTATVHFDEAVDRVNLDALTVEESDQLVQLCQEAAEAHRMLGEQEQALTVYNALLGFLRSRGWSDKVAQVEFMLQQAQQQPAARPVTPPVQAPQQAQQQRMAPQQPQQPSLSDAATMAFNMGNMPNAQQSIPPAAAPVQNTASVSGDLPDWLTGILSDADKTQLANKPSSPPANGKAAQTQVPAPPSITEQPTTEQRVPTNNLAADVKPTAVNPPVAPADPFAQQANVVASPTWLTDDIKPVNAPPVPPATPEAFSIPEPPVQAPPVAAPVPEPVVPPPTPPTQQVEARPAPVPVEPVPPIAVSTLAPTSKPALEDLLNQISGNNNKDEMLKQVADAVLASTASLPENTRLQVVRSMQDIQSYINHGLLNSAIEECLRVIDIAPQYVDVHQVLCEIYVRQGKIEQAITKYAILVDTYIVNGRIDDAVATYRRILQLDPNNLTYRMRLINLLSTQGNKEDLLRERTLAAESYLRLGYMDRALTELEQALQESPTSVSTRLNYALALQKLGRTQQATAEYQRVLQVDPRNLIALIRLYTAMITGTSVVRASTLEMLTRIRWQLRGEGQKNYDMVVREYTQAAENYPNNADIHFSLGQFHQQAGFYDQAIDEYDLAMRDSAVEVLARTSTAQCMLAQGKPEAAINQLEMALQGVRRAQPPIDPTVWAARPRENGEEHQAPEVEVSLLLANAYERTGRFEQKQNILRQIRQVRPEQDEVASTIAEISTRQGSVEDTLQEYLDLVHHYRSRRQFDSALSVLNEMIRLAPQDVRAHSELADISISRGMLDEGIAELRLLADIQLRRNQLEQAGFTIQRIGNIYANAGNNEEALSNLKRAADLNSSSMELLREVIGFCLQMGRNKDAAQYQSIIARHYFDTHQVKEAVAALQQLITIDRSNYEAYDLLGQTYQSVGEYEQASRVYKNLAKVNPDSDIARERLTTLQELRTK